MSALGWALGVLGLVPVLAFGCAPGVADPPSATAAEPSPPRAASPPPTGFDAARAFTKLEQLVEQGHRYYGAPGRGAALDRLESELRAVSDGVEREDFDVVEPVSGQTYTLTNLTARLWPEAQPRIVLGSHFDTRLWAEEDPDPARRAEPIPGANDGSSGVAVLLEVARVLRSRPAAPALGIDLVLFDGEEFGRPGRGGYCKGSEAWAAGARRRYPGALPAAGVVLDMVCDKDLTFKREPLSDRMARPLADRLWAKGAARRPDVFLDTRWPGINDDHMPLQRVGIPAILVIDFDYPAWHTHADTLDQCAPESLAAIGDALIDLIDELGRPGAGLKGTPPRPGR